MPNGVSLLIETGASVTPEGQTPRKKRNLKSSEISPPRKDPIPNQYSTRNAGTDRYNIICFIDTHERQHP